MSGLHLSGATLGGLAAQIAVPRYDRETMLPGIVHIGPGAFHRAHQAPAFEALLAEDNRWGVVEVSLHSPAPRDALAPQNGLYTLALLGEEPRYQVIGAIKDILFAPYDPEAVLTQLGAPHTKLVTLTVTEKGYCLEAAGTLDLQHRDIKADMATPTLPQSAIGYLVEGLHRRFAADLSPFTLVSCDNLSNNGFKLRHAVVTLARAQDRGAAFEHWLRHELASPRTMVDSITPATDDALRERVAAALGVADHWPVQREAFTQWVIESDPRLPELDWDTAGITVSDDVGAYEQAKLRILNASHSGLAYLGSLRGLETVADAMADPELASFVRGLMDDVGARLNGGIAVEPYKEAVLKRFRNPAIRHSLSQIAWDGSQKLPNRLFPYLQEAAAFGGPLANGAKVLAAWFLFLRRKVQTGEKLVDPLAPLLLETAARATGDPEHDVDLFLSLEAVFPPSLAAAASFRAAFADAYAQLAR